jgi:hypothetical protein
MFDLEIDMKKDSWTGRTLFRGDKLVCAAHIMNLLDDGCTELKIVSK